ncbi:MAG: hypothetical protein LQ338_004055 [Usnochroma carphineum]|nr:MAG: hypothetical protein LQ338_004055 [Usnochroma carphineum]
MPTRMLFHFHKQQNSKKPGSIRAIYLLSGLVTPAVPPGASQNGSADGEDAFMQSSPFMSSSSMPQKEENEESPAAKSVTMCRAEDLEAPAASTANKSSQGVKASNLANKAEPQPAKAQDSKSLQRRASSQGEPKPKDQEKKQRAQDTKAATKPSGLKRDASDIFKSFAKPRATLARENTGSSKGASPAPQAQSPASEPAPKVEEDVHMSDDSESDHAEDFLKSDKTADKPGGTTRFEREAQLREMMDEDGEPTEAADIKPDSPALEHAATEVPKKEQGEEAPTTATTTTSGRRRGRRRVMKKKMLKDEEGYLVTKEEPAWESFSEDEPPPPKESTPISSAAKARKTTAGKPGQGNIMAFFGKK